MLSTAETEPTSWLPPADVEDWTEGESSAGTERASKYYRARYYDPKIGRFISEDPLLWADGPNRYPYVRNSPTNYTDPSGMAAFYNGSDRTIPYKHEDMDDGLVLCPPGAWCNVDGIYPKCGEPPIKVADGCISEVGANGVLIVWCPNPISWLVQKTTGGRVQPPGWPDPNDSPDCGCK